LIAEYYLPFPWPARTGLAWNISPFTNSYWRQPSQTWIYLLSKKKTRQGKQCPFYTKTQRATGDRSGISQQAKNVRTQTAQLRSNTKRMPWKPRQELKNRATE